MGFRITTWNVNGIRNPFGYQPWRDRRTFQAMFEILEADIVVMQETKIQRKDLRDDIVLVPGWDVYFSLPRHKKGYSGVAIYTRNATCAPIRAEEGITGTLCPPGSSVRYRELPVGQSIGGYPRPDQLSSEVDDLTLDSEGRCVLLEFPAFVLLGVYSPANRDASRDAYRACFFNALDVRVRNLVAEGKQVILTGDLNVSRSELDSSNVLESLSKEGVSLDEWMSMPTRRIFNQLIFDGYVKGQRDKGRDEPVLWDLCRCYHPGRLGMNTCWDTKKNTRPANNGSRIDYILCSNGLKPWFTGADIQPGLMGSDHCPVFADLADTVSLNDQNVSLLSVLNPPTMFQDGTRARDWQKCDLLPMSAKLMTEFDRRQNIRDMFKKANSKPETSAPETTVDASTPTIRSAESNKNHAQENDRPQAMRDASKTKRPADPMLQSSQQKKRSKPSKASGRTAQGQTTLQGFFRTTSTAQSKTTGASAPGSSDSTASTTLDHGRGLFVHQSSDLCSRNAFEARPEPFREDNSSYEKVFDAVESKDQWSKLLRKPAAPRCEHDEPCISLTTKKPGINRGRSFYICPRPLGPSGEKEKNSEWRCGTFIWSSDWNGLSSQ